MPGSPEVLKLIVASALGTTGLRFNELTDFEENATTEFSQISASKGQFCMEHWNLNCQGCKERIAKMPEEKKKLPNGQNRPHLLYLHVEKTGGSSIECATQNKEMTNLGFFTNMGHTTTGAVHSCMAECSHDGIKPLTVVSIREPYKWWRSLYTYGYVCKGANLCTKDDFPTFVRSLESQTKFVQSKNIERVCGRPCTADIYLHTEHLGNDWSSMLNKQDLPHVDLPHQNPTERHPDIPPTVFTQEVVDIIHRLDANMFTEFRYKKRHDIPFELK